MAQDHDLLIQIATDITYIKQAVDGHEKRINSLELWKMWVLGIAVAVSIGASIFKDQLLSKLGAKV